MNVCTLNDLSARFGNHNLAAKRLEVNRQTYYGWKRRGKIPHYWHDLIKNRAAKYGIVIDQIVDEK